MIWWFYIGLILGNLLIIVAAIVKRGEEKQPRIVINENKRDKFEILAKLGELKTSGVITEEEFNLEKQKIMREE